MADAMAAACDGGGRRDLSPAEAVEMFLDAKQGRAADNTIQTYHYRLKQFVQWCEQEDIGNVSELNGWTIEQFEIARRTDLAPVSLKGQMASVKQFVIYLARIEAVDEGLPDKVEIPTVDRSEESSDEKLAVEDAEALIEFFRDGVANYGTVKHVVLEILWHVGCRQSGLRALDIGDFDAERQSLSFRHRPDKGTPLKNGLNSERMVAIPEAVADVVQFYVKRERKDKHDAHGRKPLITTNQGRPVEGTIRGWTYMATQPCLHMPCPHNKDRGTCDWTIRDTASNCPSSRSPHPIRTGSITWHLHRGVPPRVVSERADVSQRVLEQHYDKATQLEKMEERRREYIGGLDIQEDQEG